jgi:hypothetical protein
VLKITTVKKIPHLFGCVFTDNSPASTFRKVTMDLSHVTFVARAAMMFLCGAISRNVAIENIPSYVARWIEQEGCLGSAYSFSSEK